MKRFQWILFVAGRYVRTTRREKGHVSTILSISGIAAGAATLIVVLGVMNGFQLGTIGSILEVNSYHLQVSGTEPDAASTLSDQAGVSAVVPYVQSEVLSESSFRDPQALLVRGMPKDVMQRDSGFAQAIEIVRGGFELSGNSVVIGSELAQFAGLGLGSQLRLVSLGGEGLNLLDPESVVFEVSGIFRSGYYEYDRSWVFVSLEDAVDRLGINAAPTLGIKLRDRFRDRELANRFAEILPDSARIESWRSFNRSIFRALRTEKVIMALLLGMIFIVVAGNIYQSLRRAVYERSEDISVLRALGSPPQGIQAIFVLEGIIIGVLGGAIGVFAGMLIAVNIDGLFRLAENAVNGLLGFIEAIIRPVMGISAEFSVFSPAYFYLTEVPVSVPLFEVFAIFLFASGSAVVAAYVASKRSARILPASVLREE